ncbi:MAG: hypothetical protein JW896_03730 [Deltaproteobacteria bacterium]|nr:hypothetical protein [Deltaproteobacteria bacterium]
MHLNAFLSMPFVVRLKSSAALILSTIVSLIRIWFQDNKLNRTMIGQIALQASINGYRESALLYVAAKLDLADLLSHGSRNSSDLARMVGAHVASLHRVLRGLVLMGILSEKRDGRFALTALGTWLLSGKRNSLRNSALLCGEGRYVAFGSLIKSVMTGKPACSSPETDYYEFRKQNPDLCRSFNTEMARRTRLDTESILAAYDFRSLKTVADIGGGYGTLLSAILKAYPTHTGILFDQPHVTDDALSYLEKAGVAERCMIVGGDFFNRIQIGADVLILKNILHNWDDERSVTILRNCREALGEGGKILLMERLMPSSAKDNSNTIWLDLCMLVQMGGRERTENEYRELLSAGGFIFTTALPTSSQLWIIEAVRTGETE